MSRTTIFECDNLTLSSQSTRRGFSLGAVSLVLSATAIADSQIISEATARNWNRLEVEQSTRLVSRANKRMSKKQVLPADYFRFKENAKFAQRVAEIVKSQNVSIKPILNSLAKAILEREGLRNKPNVCKVLAEVSNWGEVDLSVFGLFQDGEPDLLGGVYQSVLYEGARNEGGIYYTREEVAEVLAAACQKGKSKTFLDPCCGSGSVLCSVQGISPENIYGFDRDEIAVFLAKINLLRRYPHDDFSPKVFQLDFLSVSERMLVTLTGCEKFDNIATNPPWGAVSNTKHLDSGEITSREVFSLFYVKSFKMLHTDGTISFLLPQSMMNVAVHRDLRAFVLGHGKLSRITQFDRLFSGVATKYVLLVAQNKVANPSDQIIYADSNKGTFGTIPLQEILRRSDLSLQFVDRRSSVIIDKITAAGTLSLTNSLWALGIVTGDNKRKLSEVPTYGYESIYTGKEIHPYRLSHARKFISFDREKMQQAAKDELYRANEKLVYRFICDKPVFAYDNTGALTLNSANVLIPRVEGMSAKTVAAFLNSDVLIFFYKNTFGGNKVLKSQLCALPFPSIGSSDDKRLSALVDDAIAGDESAHQKIQENIFQFYNLSEEDKNVIRKFIYGKTP